VAEFPKLNMRTGTDTNLKYALDHGMGAILAEGNNFTKQIARCLREACGQRLQ